MLYILASHSNLIIIIFIIILSLSVVYMFLDVHKQNRNMQRASLLNQNGSRNTSKKDIQTYMNNTPEILKQEICSYGFAYCEYQDIFYSSYDTKWEKSGYYGLYDRQESNHKNIIADCELIYFEYDDRQWLIEFKKGQYGIATGAEVGVYTKDIFYGCTEDRESVTIEFILRRNNEVLFKREGKHWRVTGFLLGVLVDARDLIMDINITLKDYTMAKSFERALKDIGYTNTKINKGTVYVTFERPYYVQLNKGLMLEIFINQIRNKILCKRYNKLLYSVQNAKNDFNIKKLYKTVSCLEKINSQ